MNKIFNSVERQFPKLWKRRGDDPRGGSRSLMRVRWRRRLENSTSSIRGISAKATQPFENVSSDEDGLVTKQWPGHRTEAARRRLPPHHPAMPVVELSLKRS